MRAACWVSRAPPATLHGTCVAWHEPELWCRQQQQCSFVHRSTTSSIAGPECMWTRWGGHDAHCSAQRGRGSVAVASCLLCLAHCPLCPLPCSAEFAEDKLFPAGKGSKSRKARWEKLGERYPELEAAILKAIPSWKAAYIPNK